MQGWAYQDITGPGHVGARAAFHGELFSRLGNSAGEYYNSGSATVSLKTYRDNCQYFYTFSLRALCSSSIF